jgi:ABC-type sugar transport system permease subunit
MENTFDQQPAQVEKPRQPRRLSNRKYQSWLYAMIAPYLVATILLVVVPVLISFGLSSSSATMRFHPNLERVD